MDEHQNCKTCKWGRWYRNGYDITMMDEECGGCCSWNSKWEPANDMIKVIVYWDAGEEEYVFENEEDARAFYVDALSKCGQIKYFVQNVDS